MPTSTLLPSSISAIQFLHQVFTYLFPRVVRRQTDFILLKGDNKFNRKVSGFFKHKTAFIERATLNNLEYDTLCYVQEGEISCPRKLIDGS